MAVISRDLGPVTAYAAAVNRGYTGTRAEFEELMASYATVAQEAGESASAAADSASDAESSASAAATSASDASSFASAANTSASNASNAATAAGIAQTAAESARNAAQSAQTAAEEAQEGAEAAVDGFDTAVTQAISDVNAAGTNQKELAKRQAEKSEAWAVGQISGEDVGVSDPAYHNNAKYYAESAGTSATTATTKASEAAQSAANAASSVAAAEDAAGRAEAAAEQAEGAIEVDDTLSVEGRAADAKKTGDEISELKEDLSDVNERLGNTNVSIAETFDYFAFGNFSIPFVQGARGSNGAIQPVSNYVTSKSVYNCPAGVKLLLDVIASEAQCMLQEWTKAGAFVGNVGKWSRHIDYTFSDKNITITLKKGSSDITPSSITTAAKLLTPYSELFSFAKNSFEYSEFNSFIQGYYNASGSYYAGTNGYACSETILTKAGVYVIPASDEYKISFYTWDYSNGTFSNMQNSGWITSTTRVELPSGKALALTIADKDSSTIVASDITYSYYLLTPIGEVIRRSEQWTPKKVACIGDSLTQGVDVRYHVIKENYPYFMSNMLGCTVLNCGVAGADTKEYWHDNMDDFTFDSSIDTVLIMLGTNGGGIPNTLATDVYPYTDYADYADTYCGCYCKIIRKVIELTQNRAQVILLTPPYTTYSTQQLARVKTARETIMEIGLYYNIPVIDVFAECGMGAYNADVFRPHDGCHFNAKGYHRLGTFIGSKVKSIHSNWEMTDEYDDETPIT